jgi:hypothetical protein
MHRLFIGLAVAFLAHPLLAACGATTFTPQRSGGWQPSFPANPAIHQALYLTDPDNEQYAVFSMEYGGMLASLRYKAGGEVLTGTGTVDPAAKELIWGHHSGAMAQTAMWGGNGTYNPTGSGDLGETGAGRGGPIYGASCKNGSLLLIYGTTVDFGKNDTTWGTNMNYGRAAALRAGVPVTDMWLTPYSITVTATFVANPLGTPKHYLKLDHYIQNTDTRENMTSGFHWTFALYAPGTTDGPDGNNTFHPESGANSFRYPAYFPANCAAATPTCQIVPDPTDPTQAKVIAGLYPNSGLIQGVAVATNALTYFSGALIGQTTPRFDTFWNNVALDIAASPLPLAPKRGRRVVVYVMAGDWNNAVAFKPQ